MPYSNREEILASKAHETRNAFLSTHSYFLLYVFKLLKTPSLVPPGLFHNKTLVLLLYNSIEELHSILFRLYS